MSPLSLLGRRWRTSVLVLLCVFLAQAAWAADLVPVPPFKAYLTDSAKILQPAQASQLEARLAALSAQTGSQVAVLTVPSTQPEDIAAYAIRVADAWKVGRQNIDDGVILVVAVDDRKLRIEVGRGLEGGIPDAIAKRIVSDTITPAFKNGEYYLGIAAGIEQIAARIGAEALAPPASNAAQDQGPLWPFAIFFIIMIIAMLRRGPQPYYNSRRGRALGMGTGIGLSSGGFGGGFGGGGGGGFGGGGGGGFGGGGASGGW